MIACLPVVAAAQPEPAAEPEQAAEPAKPAAEPVAPPPPAAPAPAVLPPAEDKPRFSWQPFGYLRLQYIAVQNDPNVAFVGRDDGFELQNARLGVRGNLQQRVSFLVAIDGAVDERAQNTPQGKLKVGLRDAFADVMLGAGIAVHGGYFQTWVDPQGLVTDTARETIDKPIESRGMRSTEGWYTPGLPPGRSLGAALRLDPTVGQIGFELAVQNGADEFASNNDNDTPAVSVAALYRLAAESFLVAAARWNPRTVGELPFRQDETDLQGSLGAQVGVGLVSIGIGAIVQHTTFESTNGPAQNAYGGHAQLFVRIPASQPIAIGYRFGILDPSSLIVTDRIMEHTLGAVLGLPVLHMRAQLQLTHVQEQAERELSNDRIQLAAEVAF